MRFTAIAIAAVASLSSFAMADNCQEGLNYCGYVLMRKGTSENFHCISEYIS